MPNNNIAVPLSNFDQGALLASTLIYNSSGSIDEKSVQRLTFIGQLSKVISANQTEIEKSATIGADETVSSIIFPRFIWTLRDFSLKLVGEDGVSSISSDEYMELQLANKTGYDQAILKRNRICSKWCTASAQQVHGRRSRLI